MPATVLGKPTRCTKCGQPFTLAEHVGPTSVSAPADVIVVPPGDSDDIGQGLHLAGNSESAASALDAPASPPPFITPPAPIEHSTHQARGGDHRQGPRRFLALRIVARILEIYAVIVGIWSIVRGLLPVTEVAKDVDANSADWTEAIILCLTNWLVGATAVVVLLFMSNLIRLGLQIEQNTFESRNALRQIKRGRDDLSQSTRDP